MWNATFIRHQLGHPYPVAGPKATSRKVPLSSPLNTKLYSEMVTKGFTIFIANPTKIELAKIRFYNGNVS
jgi:hypothetical protein